MKQQKEIKESIPFTTAPKKKKRYLEINLNKEVNDPYSENYRTQMGKHSMLMNWKNKYC